MTADERQSLGSAYYTICVVIAGALVGFCTSAVFWNESTSTERTRIMFSSLDEQIERGQGRKSTTERLLQYAGVLLMSTVLFGGLYVGIRFLE